MPLPDSAAALAILVATALLLTLWWTHRQSAGARAKKKRPEEELDTVQAWPPQAVRIMTAPERKAYEILRRALPQHMVLAQVPLSRFVSVPVRHSYVEWLDRVGRLSVDLLVCDFSSRIIAAIEIRGAEETPRARQRHERMSQVLRAAGLKVHVWPVLDLPSLGEVREMFGVTSEGTVSQPMPLVDHTGRTAIPVPEMQELLSAGDEFDYHHDPVPSAFFDEQVGARA
jgi:hypothetical protein